MKKLMVRRSFSGRPGHYIDKSGVRKCYSKIYRIGKKYEVISRKSGNNAPESVLKKLEKGKVLYNYLYSGI